MPPFASRNEHKVFLDSLRFHLAALGGLDGTVPVSILNGLLSSVNLEQKTLSELELQLCLQSFFPAPWALGDLAELVNDRQKSFRPTPEGGWRWLFDPEFEAKPDPEGGWLLLRHERGSFEEDKLDADYDLCLLWMSMMSDRGWGTNKYEFAKAEFLAPEAAARIRESVGSRFNVAQALAERGQPAQQAAPVQGDAPAQQGTPVHDDAPSRLAAKQATAESPGWFGRLFRR